MTHHYGPPREIPSCKRRPLTEGNTMHNPKPEPSTMQPSDPPGPQVTSGVFL